MSDFSLFLMLGVILAGVAALALFGARYYRHMVQRFSKMTSGIGSARPGWVELRGKVVAKEIFSSPVSDKRCVYMHVVLHHADVVNSLLSVASGPANAAAQGADDHSMNLVKKADRIWIQDKTGRLPVDLTQADFELKIDRAFRSGALSVDDPLMEKALRRLDVNPTYRTGSYTLEETILEPDDEILVTGTLTVDGAGQMFISGTPEDPVHVTDLPVSELTARYRQGALWCTIGFVGLALLSAWMFVTALISAHGSASKPPPEEEEANTTGNWGK